MAIIPNVPLPPNYANTSAYNSSSTPWNPFNQRDVYNQYQDIGKNQFQQGQDWQNQFANLSDYYGNLGSGYGNLTNDLYSDIWNGGGGYSQDQMNNVLQSQGLQDINNQAGDNQLNTGEKTAILGDPYAAFNMFGGQAKALGQQATDNGTNLTQLATAGQNQGNQVVNQATSDYRNAVDPSKLSLSSSYAPSIQSALGLGASSINKAQNDPGLNVTDDYLRQAGMTDQQVQQTADAAARTVGAQFGATKDQLLQNAQASGTSTPLGIASAMGALDRSSAAGQSDAQTKARLDAQAAQRQAATGIQQTQLNAGQYRAGLGSQNALALQNAGIAANTTGEQLRLGAQQNLTQDQMNAAQQTGALGLNNSQYNTNAGLNAATQAGNWGQQTGQYNATNAANLMSQAEQNSSTRNQQVAGNRQSTNQYNQGMEFNTNQALSSRYQQGYAPYLANQTEGRQAAQGQEQYYGGQQNQQNQFRLGGAQTYNQGELGAANGYAGWGQNETNNGGVAGAFHNVTGLLGAVSGASNSGANVYRASQGHAHGGLINHHQMIEVGEHNRPEAILPLDPHTPPGHRNPWELMGARLGEALGIKSQQKHFATGGIIGIDDPNLFSHNARDLEVATDPDQDQSIPGYKRGGIIPPVVRHMTAYKMNFAPKVPSYA